MRVGDAGSVPGWVFRFSWCAGCVWVMVFALAMLCSCTAQESGPPSTSLNIGGATLDITLPAEPMEAGRDDL